MISNNSLSKSMCVSYLQSSNMSHDGRLTVVRPSFDCRSKLLKLVTVLALLLTVGVGNVWGAEEIAYTLTCPKNTSGSNYATNYDITVSSIGWNAPGNQYENGQWRIGVSKKTAAGSDTRRIYSKTAITQNITKVILTHGAKTSNMNTPTVTLNVYSTAAKAASGGTGDISSVSVTYVDNGTMTFNRPTGHDWTGRFYRIDYSISWTYSSSANYILLSSVVFKYESGTSVSLEKAGQTNGTFTLTQSSSPVTSVTTTSAAQAVTVTATPAAGYYLSNLTASNPATGTAEVTGSGNTRTVTYSQGANGSSTITATFSCVTPTISVPPASKTDYTVGDAGDALSVTASANNANLGYQWQVSNNNSDWSDIASGDGGTAETYTPSTAAAGTKYYRVIVSNAATGCSTNTTSAAATITVAAAAYFPNSKTLFIEAGKDGSAWDASACVKAWFRDGDSGGEVVATQWLANAGDGKKIFATVIPSSGSYRYMTIQRFTEGCGSFWNDNGAVSKVDDGGSNVVKTTCSTNTCVSWSPSALSLYLRGNINNWEGNLATLSDQNAGIWTASYNNYTATATSRDFRITDSYDNMHGSGNTTLEGMIVGSTYDITASYDVTSGTLEMSKTFVKGTVHFDMQGHGSAISDLENVTAGSKISAPSPAPSVTGWDFGGWFKEPACTNEWNFATDEVSETMTLYAKWTVKTYTITKTFSNVANAGLPESFTYTGSETTALNSSFTVDGDNFFLPSSITVTMAGTGTLTQGTHYTYNSSTGAFTFLAVITGNIEITATATAKLKSIAITTPPTTRAYLAGESFSSTGAVVTATMGDGSTKAVTASTIWSPSIALTAETGKVITASYTENGITKTASTTINVYSVTVQKYDETPAEITNASVTVGASGRTLSQSVGSTKYVFNNWTLITASGMGLSGSNLTGTPTGDVVVRGNFYKPITITWLKGGMSYATGEPTTEVARGAQWKDLTIPTAPGNATLGACATKFMGWSNSMDAEWVKEDHHSAPGTLFTSVSGNTTTITGDITFRAVFATESASSTTFKRVTALSELDNAAKIVIISNSTYTASIKTDASNGTAPTETSSQITPGNGFIWSLSGNSSSGWQFKNSSNNSLGATTVATSGNNNQAVSITSTNSTWTIGSHNTSNCFYIRSGAPSATDTKACLDVYNSNWQLYYVSSYISNSYTAMRLYVPLVTYSDYVTVCCTQYDITKASSGSVTGGTFTTSAASACEGAEVTLTATPSDGYAFAGWTVTNTSGGADVTNEVLGAGHAGDNPATMTMPGQAVTVNATFATLTGITVKTAPTKTTYCEGDYFDPTGLVITASFSNSTSLDIPYAGNEAKFTFSPTTSTALTTGNSSVSISYGGQSTSQAITVNAHRTISLTGSGTVTGGTFTADETSACVGATITIEVSAADHYSFNSWTIEKAGGGTVTPVSATSASTTFIMPDANVTVTASFNESAFHYATFKNDGVAVSGYDQVKVYDGTKPVPPTLTDVTDACDKTECNLFYGWIADGDEWDETTDDISAKTIYRRASDLPNVSGVDVTYHAVWAKGSAAPAVTTPTPIAAWNKNGSGISASTNYSANTGTGTLTSNIDMSGTGYSFMNTNTGISTAPVITLSGLNLSGASTSTVNISFYTRGSKTSAGTLTVEYSSNNGSSYGTAGTVTIEDGIINHHEITGIPKTTNQIRLTHAQSTGSFSIGTFKIYEPVSGTWNFTELTSANTSGWTTTDWEGDYIITNGSTTALNGYYFEDNKCLVTVSPSTGVISLNANDAGNAFRITYSAGNSGYSVQGIGGGLYLKYKNNSVDRSESAENYYSMGYNSIIYNTLIPLQWNSTKFGFYSSSYTSLKLYKTLSTYTKWRVSCCVKNAITLTGTPAGTVEGGTFAADKTSACADATVTLSVTSTSTGYNFDHWTVVPTGGGDEITVTDNHFTMPDEAVTVTAVFVAAHTTTVTLNAQGGVGGTSSVTATVNLPMPDATMPTKSGYEFGGYYLATNGSGTQYYAADGSSAHDWDNGVDATEVLYANWLASGYTVTLNKEGATTQGTASVSVSYGSNTNLTSAITCPTYTNKVFGGYWTTASGEGTQLIDGDGNWIPNVTSYTGSNKQWLYADNIELHARWSNVSYTNYRTTCGPEIDITVSGTVRLTTYAGCEVLTPSTSLITVSSDDWKSTVGNLKYLNFRFKDKVSGVTYTHTSSSVEGSTQKIANSEFRIYNASDNGGSYADGGYIEIPAGTTSATYSFRIAYKPTAGVYNTQDHYLLEVEAMDNSATKKTITLELLDLYGRTLPEEFAIAIKKDNQWYALPNDLAGTEAASKAIAAIPIVVDNATTPTCAMFAPENVLYRGAQYYDGPTVANRNRSGVRFTRNGSQWLQVSTVVGTNNMWLSSTGGTDVQDWYLNSETFNAYTVKLDPRVGTGGYKDKTMGMYGSNIGFYSSPTVSEIYFLPVETVLEDASVVEWGKNSFVMEVDAGSYSEVIARVGDAATGALSYSQTRTSVNNSSTTKAYTINVGNAINFDEKADQLLYLDWLNESGAVAGVSMVPIPWIIEGTKTMSSVDAVKAHWEKAEVHVLPGATLTADAGTFSDVTIKQLEIYPGATVNVTTGILTTTNLMLRNGWTRAGEKAYGAARLYITPSAGSLTATNVYADWYIDYDQYYPVSVPWKVATSGITYLNTSNAASSSVIKLRYYDGEGRANGTNGSAAEGANWKEFTPWPETMEPGVGYAMTARRPTGKAFSIVRMPLTLPSGAWTSGTWTTGGEKGYVGEEPSRIHKDEVAVTAWGVEDMTKPRYAVGWNFIAQPYMSIYQGPITHSAGSDYDVEFVNIPDIRFKEYDQYAVGALGQKLLPAGGFFIQTEKTGTLTFGTTYRKASAPSYHNELQNLTTKQKAYIILNGDEDEDMMGLLVSDHYTADYDINGDLEKLMGDGNDLKAYMRYGDMNMAYVAINETLAKEWIPVSVRIPADGEYTFSLHEASIAGELEGVYLIDYQNGDKITNLIEQSYTFSSTAGTINGRFAINAKVGERQTPTGIDAINAGGDINSDKPFKFIYHDKVYIWLNGVIYDTTGKRVK